MTYQEYLKTDHWQRVRLKIFSRYHRLCAMCRTSYLLNAHHIRYTKDGKSIWFREATDDLILFCRTCHKTLHTAEGIDMERFKRQTQLMSCG